MVSSEEEADAKPGQTVEWDTDMEIQLFYAMANYKPVGINKHFHIVGVWDKLSNSITKEVTTEDIRKHLETMYDMTMLDDTEPIPFPNNEVEFSLPEDEFGILVKQKCREAIVAEEFDESSSTSPKPATPRSSSRGAVSKDNTPKAGGRKDSTASITLPAAAVTKARKESGSSHASTDTPSIKSEKDYERRRDSRDSNASSSRDNSTSRKSTSHRTKASPGAVWDSPAPDAPDDEARSRRGRRRPNTSTPPTTTPAKRRRT